MPENIVICSDIVYWHTVHCEIITHTQRPHKGAQRIIQGRHVSHSAFSK